MKKILLLSALAFMGVCATAQIVQQPSVSSNWSIGIDGGVTTPLVDYPFFKSMRGAFGLSVGKQLTPIVGVGIEGQAYINTSAWGAIRSKTMIDASYVGAYGTINLMNLFGGYQCAVRPFAIDVIAGAGWGHQYWTKSERPDNNFMATKAGLNFNFNVSDKVTISLQPSVMYNMTQAGVSQTSAAYNAKKATFNMLAGVRYNFGGNGFECVVPMDPTAIEALNAEVNALRGAVEDATIAAAGWQATAADLQDQLAAAQAEPQVVETTITEVNNYLNTVRYVFFKIGSSVITNDQMPNVEMIAAYMKNNPDATVVIKGYASKDGPEEVNIRLAQARAESVKNALINKYGVKADRIKAEGQGIGEMFKEESWNRVSICTIIEE